MWHLYGIKRDGSQSVVATFDSEQSLLAYVRWATLSEEPDGTLKFEQKTPLTGCVGFDHSPRTAESETSDVPHNPTPGML